ncbi:nitrite reductase large subunit NirB [Priestia endophytica]|uniref:nitrite reductase large subunit NirB n=1 Tax=Priestia endophytica TaxID=135735 RepID=UPI00124D9AB7|nr:nitrite reductase large subunit NirB [Priestia endophytica]KAB2493291.1 NAD(P)/FAD-dependent oxidoreductase [Priestia endophytica]
MEKQKLVVIGNGMAGVRAVEEILKLDPNRFSITIFGSEPHPNYNRIMLSKVLQGDTEISDIVLNSLEWYEENNITLHKGEEVIKIDRETKTLFTNKGREESYDKLIIATGSNPLMIPFKGIDKEGVVTFRDIADCEKMVDASKQYKKAAVIGGGLLGLEAARGLLNLGMEVDVIQNMPYVMNRQLDETAGNLLQKSLGEQGMNILVNHDTDEFLGEERVTGIRFKDGSEIKADLIVMAIGIVPNTSLAKESGLTVNRGIAVDDHLQTSDPNIFSVGECAEHRGIAYGLVAPLYEQGKVLAHRILEHDCAPYEGSVLSTQLKVSGVDVFSAGEFMEHEVENAYAIKIFDEVSNVYKKLLVKDEKLIGAVLFGDTKDGNKLFQMIQKGSTLEGLSPTLFSTNSGKEESLVASMSDDDIICGCNGVSKGTICSAISEGGLTSVDEVKDVTTACRSCGGCKPLVAELISLTAGSEVEQKEAICSCTTLSRDEVVAEIKEKGLTHSKEVMNVLGWKNDEGCSKCRPALNYYLGMIDPEQYEDERESRFVNERMHANIQKDGTFSVVPRMYGGVTNPKELRKIADVADKYNIPLVKVTGGQRLDLLGAKKEDLPKIWEELDMPSGYAYGKTLRTVKTCVGESFCRFGTQDSMGLGIKLEKKFERLQTPHKVKMSVSACPRNCAESGIKDVGIVGIEGAFEIYVGGNGGTHLRAGDLLCKVATEEEVMEMSSAFLQYYRENANYLERTSAFVERVGLAHIKEVLDNLDTRTELNIRMDKALAVTTDPWREIIENKNTKNELFTNVMLQKS